MQIAAICAAGALGWGWGSALTLRALSVGDRAASGKAPPASRWDHLGLWSSQAHGSSSAAPVTGHVPDQMRQPLRILAVCEIGVSSLPLC